MKIKKISCCRFWMVGIFTVLFLAFAGSHSFAADVSPTGIVPVVLKGNPDIIIPVTVTAKPGTTVAWLNMGPGPATIKFITKIGLACSAPSNFYGDLLGYYETTPLVEGATASICFIAAGNYEYEVRRISGGTAEKPLESITSGKVICAEK
ncbi:MAG: hypothetical protein JW832_16290 [Deltaproteobacteria bacterium]|nr:hypothetical protein [Deltaproteobacteria bacterium]